MDYFHSYQKYKSKYLNLKNTQKGGSQKELYLFKAEWCGHCKSFANDWKTLQADDDLKSKLKFITMDADVHKKEIESWKVMGFPTIILKNGDKAIEYNGARKINEIKDFINKN